MPSKSSKDPFQEASTPAEMPAKYVSSSTVDVGEGIRFAVTRFEVIPDRFSEDDEGKVGEITGDVLESRAHRFTGGQELVVTCKAARLEALANEAPNVGDVVVLVRNEDVGKSIGWGFTIERGAEGSLVG
jgi:hypothetical protein